MVISTLNFLRRFYGFLFFKGHKTKRCLSFAPILASGALNVGHFDVVRLCGTVMDTLSLDKGVDPGLTPITSKLLWKLGS